MILAVIALPTASIPFENNKIIIVNRLQHFVNSVCGSDKKYTMIAFGQFMAIIAITCLSLITQAQPAGTSAPFKETEKSSKPYRILTSGKQITIKSTKDIKSIIVWTSDGNRILEHKDINASNYTFRITVREKIFFIRIQLADGKTYSEKIGVE